MSRGPWKKETSTRQTAVVNRLRAEQRAKRDATDRLLLSAIEESDDPLSEAQLAERTGLVRATVEKALHRLRNHGLVRKCAERRRVGRFGNLACVYELGDEGSTFPKRSPVKFTAFRHPMDIAFFGEYERRAA